MSVTNAHQPYNVVVKSDNVYDNRKTEERGYYDESTSELRV